MRNKGFTLIELIAVITILGIILMIAVPSYNKHIENAKNRQCEADIHAIEDAINTYMEQQLLKGNQITFNDNQATINYNDIKNILGSDLEKYKSINFEIERTGEDDTGIYEYKLISNSINKITNICKN